MDNALLHASGNYLEDKIEERITFSLSYAYLYLSESDEEQDGKYDAEKKSIYPVVVEYLALHYQPSMSLYWLLLMYFFVEYSCQLGFYKMIHYLVIIWWIETMIQWWE